MSSIEEIIIPQLYFEGVDQDKKNLRGKFVKIFCDLYRIELFKDGLDLILTQLQKKQLHFEIREMKGWDTNVGCFLTNKITLRGLTHNVLAHEMAHAFVHESKINLSEDFRLCVLHDMKGRIPQILTLKGEVKRLMIDALEAYPLHQFLDEIFARYFELLSISRNIVPTGDFTTSDVMDFFINITNFIEKIFNPQIRKKVDPKIAIMTANLKLSAPEQKFRNQIESKQKNSWSGRIRPNNPFKIS